MLQKVIQHIYVFFSLIILLALTGCCGMGDYYGDDSNHYYAHRSYLVLQNKLDTIKSIHYDIKPDTNYLNSNYAPLKLSLRIPTQLTVTTLYHQIHLSLLVPTKTTYTNGDRCEDGITNIDYGNPLVDSISFGTAVSHTYTITNDAYYDEITVDSIFLAP